MKRIRVILGWLVAGAMVNVAVACAMWVNPTIDGIRSTWVDIEGLKIVEGWSVSRMQGVGAKNLSAMARSSPPGEYTTIDEVLPRWSTLAEPMDRDLDEALREIVKQENAEVIGPIAPTILAQKGYGFPLRSLFWNWDGGVRKASPSSRHGLSLGIDVPQRPSRFGGIDLQGMRALPLGLLPVGFALNTLLYAALLWLAIPGPFLLRRVIRRKRGRCLSCAYDLRGTDHAACPECGAEVAGGRSS